MTSQPSTSTLTFALPDRLTTRNFPAELSLTNASAEAPAWARNVTDATRVALPTPTTATAPALDGALTVIRTRTADAPVVGTPAVPLTFTERPGPARTRVGGNAVPGATTLRRPAVPGVSAAGTKPVTSTDTRAVPLLLRRITDLPVPTRAIIKLDSVLAAAEVTEACTAAVAPAGDIVTVPAAEVRLTWTLRTTATAVAGTPARPATSTGTADCPTARSSTIRTGARANIRSPGALATTALLIPEARPVPLPFVAVTLNR